MSKKNTSITKGSQNSHTSFKASQLFSTTAQPTQSHFVGLRVILARWMTMSPVNVTFVASMKVGQKVEDAEEGRTMKLRGDLELSHCHREGTVLGHRGQPCTVFEQHSASQNMVKYVGIRKMMSIGCKMHSIDTQICVKAFDAGIIDVSRVTGDRTP